MAKFDRLDAILQANTDDIFELGKIAGLNDIQIRSIFKNGNLNNVDVRNMDLSEFNLKGTSFNGVIANAYTQVNLSPAERQNFYDAAHSYHRARLFKDGRMYIYHFDELVRLESALRVGGTPQIIDTCASHMFTSYDNLYFDDTDTSGRRIESLFPELFNEVHDVTIWREEFSLINSENEYGFLLDIADGVIQASNHEYLKGFDKYSVRGHLVAQLRKMQNKWMNTGGRISETFVVCHTVMRTIPAYSISLNVELVTNSDGGVTIENVWSELHHVEYRTDSSGKFQRVNKRQYSGTMICVPTVMIMVPAEYAVTDEYNYQKFRYSPIGF